MWNVHAKCRSTWHRTISQLRDTRLHTSVRTRADTSGVLQHQRLRARIWNATARTFLTKLIYKARVWVWRLKWKALWCLLMALPQTMLYVTRVQELFHTTPATGHLRHLSVVSKVRKHLWMAKWHGRKKLFIETSVILKLDWIKLL